MSQNERFVRRNRVDERFALGIAVAGGVLATLAGARPTGFVAWDVVLTALAVGAVVWAAASAPWWAPATAAGIGAAIAVDPVVALLGAIGFAVGLYVGVKRRDQAELRAFVAAIAMNVLIRSELAGFLGLSAIIAITVGAALFVVGVRRRPAATRRIAWIASATVGAVVVIALGGLALTGVSARPDLTTGANSANRAITVLNQGDYQQAATLFENSAAAFGRADNRLGGFMAAPSRLLPGIAQNVDAGADLAAEAAVSTREAAAALRSIDPETLRVVEGRIDLAAIAATEAPLLRVQGVLDSLDATSTRLDSPWLIAPVQDELADLDRRIAENQPRLDNAIDAVRLAPQMLGGDGLRRYLILFTTPVEARGLAGFVGNYAVVTADNGQIDVAEFGRRSDLEQYVIENKAACTDCPQEFLDRYGRFGITGGDEFGGFGDRGWTSVTLPAHFPYAAEAAQILFPQSGGDPIDGVIAMDPYVIQALMRYTGPITVPDLGLTVDPNNAANFILRDQYELVEGDDTDNTDRIDALEVIGTETIERLLSGSLPVPSDIARDLGPLATEQRLLVWTDDADEQSLLDRVGMLGALPELGNDGGFGLMVSNAGHSKIDAYLERTVDVNIDTDDDGNRTLVADVTLTNTAPADGLPRYVIGNSYGFPEGTSWLWLNFFGPEGLESATRNGEPIELVASAEAGWTAWETYEVLASGDTVEFQLVFELQPPTDLVDEPVVWSQPLWSRPA